MKIRNGFVSNSSTSSFVLFTDKENFDKVYAEADSITKKFIDMIKSETKFKGIDLVSISYVIGNYSTFEDNLPEFTEEEEKRLEEELDGEWHELIDNFEEALRKNGETIEHSEDM